MPPGPGSADAGPSDASNSSGYSPNNRPVSSHMVASPGPSGAYYGYGTPWQYNSWQAPYGLQPNSQQVSGHQSAAYPYLASASSFPRPSVPAQNALEPETRPASPTPPPKDLPRHWDVALKAFLVAVGLTQALRGFELDMLVMNEDRERKVVPGALDELQTTLTRILRTDDDVNMENNVEERKLDYVHLADDTPPRAQTSINKSISTFLAQNRRRNDASNRSEFLKSIAEKRRRNRPSDESSSTPEAESTSCARTDAKTIDRERQMKYDIAKNDEGPLRRTMNAAANISNTAVESTRSLGITGSDVTREAGPTADRYPALDERLQNIEEHFAVRYVPSPPRSLLDRLRHLEDHIIRLEKDYPPWAALHFNQPRRGWPPPPRQTPVLVTTSRVATESTAATSLQPASAGSAQLGSTADTAGSSAPATMDKGKKRAKTSSLHRAVMEKLEIQKAREELGMGGK